MSPNVCLHFVHRECPQRSICLSLSRKKPYRFFNAHGCQKSSVIKFYSCNLCDNTYRLLNLDVYLATISTPRRLIRKKNVTTCSVNTEECGTTQYTRTHSHIERRKKNRAGWRDRGVDPDASAQCNADIEHTRLVRGAAKCAPESRTDSR